MFAGLAQLDRPTSVIGARDVPQADRASGEHRARVVTGRGPARVRIDVTAEVQNDVYNGPAAVRARGLSRRWRCCEA